MHQNTMPVIAPTLSFVVPIRSNAITEDPQADVVFQKLASKKRLSRAHGRDNAVPRPGRRQGLWAATSASAVASA